MAGRLFKQEVALLQALSRHARANAIGYLALFVALSGTALAAGSLARNSVGTAQLKNRAVTGRKVARKTLTGFNIRVSTLGTVPNSNRLGGLPPFAFQARVTGACSGNRAIAHITFTGTVVCHATAGSAITRVAAGTDLTGGGSSGTVTLSADENRLQHRVSGTCSSGSAISSIGRSGTVACQSTTNITQMLGGSAGALGSASPSFLAPLGLSTPNAAETEVDTLASAVQSTAGNLSVKLSVAPGGTSSWRFALVVNGSVAVGCSIAAAATTCANTTDKVALPAGARVALEAIPSGSPATGARAMFGWTASS